MDPDPSSHGQGPSSPPPLYGSQATSKTKAIGKPRLRFAEEQRYSWPKSWHSKSEKGDKKGGKSEKGAAATPGVYWSDDAEPNESQYTFYREGTPTPPEYDDEGRERGFHYGGMTGPNRESSRGMAPSFNPPPLHPLGSRVCGMRKGLFWTLLILVGVALVAVGIGTGVGVGLAKTSSHASASANAPPNSTASGASSVSPTPAISTPAASSVSSAPPAETTTSILCQTTNNTIYNVPGSTKTFRRFCAIDYSGIGGASDITSVMTSNMEDCMISCSGLANCTGCGWGVIPNDIGPKHRCWLKGDLQTPHNASLDWSFAILL